MNKDNRPESTGMLQEELQRSRQIIKAVFNSTRSSIFLFAPDYCIIFFNKKAHDGSKLLYGRDMVVGDNMLNYRREGDEPIFEAFKTDFEQAVVTKCPVISERELHYPQMSFWVRLEYTPVCDESTLHGVLLHVQDISDCKRFEIENQEKAAKLTEISRSHSHEMRQPLASLLGLLNILEKDSLTPENQKIVNLMEDTACKLEKVIQQNVIRSNVHMPGNIY